MDEVCGELGIYDFFNVITSGAIFFFGVYIIWPPIYDIFWNSFESETVGIVFAVASFYFSGLFWQEVGSLFDRKFTKIKKMATHKFLKRDSYIVKNPVTWSVYFGYAKDILEGAGIRVEGEELTEDQMNYVYSRCQYHVIQNGNDKKMERMRALFDMSRTLATIALALFIFSLVMCRCTHAWSISSACISHIMVLFALIFYERAKKTMRYMMLVLLGSFEANCYPIK